MLHFPRIHKRNECPYRKGACSIFPTYIAGGHNTVPLHAKGVVHELFQFKHAIKTFTNPRKLSRQRSRIKVPVWAPPEPGMHAQHFSSEAPCS